MPEIVSGSLTAGAVAISSYSLEWNQGSGTNFVEVVGEASENLQRVITVTPVVAGWAYTFRYRVKNIHGWSPGYSPEATVVAANKPTAPATVTTQLIGTSVRIDWAPPAANGAPIQYFTIEIRDKSGEWHEETTFCDGADPDTKSTTACTVPLSTLTAPSGNFQLRRGDLVVARVTATNQLGAGEASSPNVAGARVQTTPGAP
jgi:hypothetical protein